MNLYYMIFSKDRDDKIVMLNITNDYYYFRRLIKKYKKEHKIIYPREISLDSLIENSQFTR